MSNVRSPFALAADTICAIVDQFDPQTAAALLHRAALHHRQERLAEWRPITACQRQLARRLNRHVEEFDAEKGGAK